MTTIETIREALRRAKVQLFESADKPMISVLYPIADRRIEIRIYIEDDGQFLYIRVGDLVEIKPEHPAYGAVVDEVLRNNFSLRFVKVCIDPTDGEVVVSGESWVLGDSLNMESFDIMFQSVTFGAKHVLQEVRALMCKWDLSKYSC